MCKIIIPSSAKEIGLSYSRDYMNFLITSNFTHYHTFAFLLLQVFPWPFVLNNDGFLSITSPHNNVASPQSTMFPIQNTTRL